MWAMTDNMRELSRQGVNYLTPVTGMNVLGKATRELIRPLLQDFLED